MHSKKNIIICKFNLKNKCKFGEKCHFKHLNIDELNDILNKFEDLKQKYDSLEKNFKEKYGKQSNLDKTVCDVIKNNINKTSKPLYNSFFTKSKHLTDTKIKSDYTIKAKEVVKSESIVLKSIKPKGIELNSQTNNTILKNVEDDQKDIKLVPIAKKQESIEKNLNNQIIDKMTQNPLRAGTVKNDIENCCNHRNETDKHIINCIYLHEKTTDTTSKILQSMISDKLVAYTFMIRVFEKLGPKCLEEEQILIKHLKEEIDRLIKEKR